MYVPWSMSKNWGVLIGELRGDQVGDDVECAGQLRVCAGVEAHDLPRVVGVELGLDWSGRARLRVEFCAEGPGRSALGGAGFCLSLLDGVGGGCRFGPRVLHPGRKDLHFGKAAVSGRFSYTPGEVERRGIKHETGDHALSVPQGLSMGRVDGAELGESVGELDKEPLAVALEAADAAHAWNPSPE